MRCPACDTGNEATRKFSRECGTALAAAPATPAPPATLPAAAERRLVSVLFVDLVGFTTLSERRDPEDVRELLSRYFDTTRRLVERYGGVVEKFIGDAVMAVWGTPRPRRTTPSGPSGRPSTWSRPWPSSGPRSVRTSWPPGPGC